MAKYTYRFTSDGVVFMPGMIDWLRAEKEHDEAQAIRSMIDLMPTVPAKHVLRILDGDCEDRRTEDALIVVIED